MRAASWAWAAVVLGVASGPTRAWGQTAPSEPGSPPVEPAAAAAALPNPALPNPALRDPAPRDSAPPATAPTAVALPRPAPDPAASPTPAPAEGHKAPPPALTVRGGLGKGVIFASEDERFTVNLRARMQLLGYALVEPDADESPVLRAMVRRARLVLQGNAWGPTLKYYLQLGFSNLDQEPDERMPLRDATLIWTPHRDASLRIGQMKVPFGKQRVTSSSALELVDRSIVIPELGLDRDVGVFAFSKDLFGLGSRLGYAIGVFGGDGRNRIGTAPGVLSVARLELRPFGNVDEELEGDLERSPRPRLQLGAAAAYNDNTNRPRSVIGAPYEGARFSYHHLEVDVLFKWSGLSVLAELYYRGADAAERTTTVDGAPLTEYARPGWGAFGQVSYMVVPGLLFAGRYSRIVPRGSADPTFALQNEAGGGASYFFEGHNLKVQGDYFALFGDGAPASHQIRVQTQLFF